MIVKTRQLPPTMSDTLRNAIYTAYRRHQTYDLIPKIGDKITVDESIQAHEFLRWVKFRPAIQIKLTELQDAYVKFFNEVKDGKWHTSYGTSATAANHMM